MPWSITSEHFPPEKVEAANAEAARMGAVFAEIERRQAAELSPTVDRSPTIQSLGAFVSVTTVSPQEFADMFPTAHADTDQFKSFN